MLRKVSLVLVFSFLLGLHIAKAAESEAGGAGSQELANPFSDYVPFEDEYDIDEDERFMYFGRFFAISLGTGIHSFTGNIGKLYNMAVPVLDFRTIYFFDFRLAGQFGVSNANHAFNAQPNGFVEVNLLRLNGDIKYFFDTKDSGATISSANPYIVGGISQTFRTQVFQTLNTVQKDNAFALNAGLGAEFVLKPRKSSIGLEGRMHQIYFKDRYDETYLDSGVPDTTGKMYSIITSVIFFF